jgi:hypothetical protein
MRAECGAAASLPLPLPSLNTHSPSFFPLPLAPLRAQNVRYSFEAPITCISPTGAADSVRVHILRGPPSAPVGGGPAPAPQSTSGAAPIVTAVIAMPLSQPLPTEA